MKILSTIAFLVLLIAAVPKNNGPFLQKGWNSLFDGKSKVYPHKQVHL